MVHLSRRSLLGAAAGFAAMPAFAAFPDKPIRIFVPWNPGAAADVLTRAIANSITANTGKTVIVENRPGANGSVGAQQVSRSAADGYTMLVSNADTHALNPFVFRKLPYDPLKGFEPVSLFAHVPFALVSGPSKHDVTDLKTMISAAKARPNALTYASWGVGSTSHIGMEMIMRKVGIEMHHVPYPGQTPGLMAVQGGHIDTMLLTAGGADAAAKGNTAKLLGVAAAKRLELMPNTPTLRELGVDVVSGNWFGFHAPAGTPADVVRQLARMTADALRDPKVQETFRIQAAIPEALGPEQLAKFVLSQQAHWGPVIRAANVSID